MCLGIPGEVVEIHPEHADLAKVNVSGVRRTINIGLLADDPPAPGEWVLIHVGFALSRVDEDEALATLKLLQRMGEAYEQELEDLKTSVIE
jgi:hydrogenase expression/formation protein HypC